MPDYWLDADVLIRAKNEYYAFDFETPFWKFLERKNAEGVLASCRAVYDELVKREDELKTWASEQHQNGFFWEPDQPVQSRLRTIADYVRDNYKPQYAAPFLAGADPWVIAQASVNGGFVVSNEASAPGSYRPKIPDIARQFHVVTKGLFEVLPGSALSGLIRTCPDGIVTTHIGPSSLSPLGERGNEAAQLKLPRSRPALLSAQSTA